MPIDDSFLKKEAAKRRAMLILICVLMVNFLIVGVLLGTGFFYEEPFIARLILYSEGVIFGILYLVLRKKFKGADKK